MELNDWQVLYVTATFVKGGLAVEVNWRKDTGAISSMSSKHDIPDEFDTINTISDVHANGWIQHGDEVEDIVEMMPSLTYHTVADEIVAMAPELLGPKKDYIKGLVKKLGHVEKHSVYNRVKLYSKRTADAMLLEFLETKELTHRNLSRLDTERLGRNEI